MSQKPLTYADAGVSIEAGNALVKAIGPLARSTARPGADAELGGFAGFFDLKAAGYSDPLLVAANDGVGTKLKLAIELGRHDGVGIDLVAMCANDLIVQGAEPLEPTTIYVRQLLPLVQERRIKGLAHITGGGILENIPRVLPQNCHAVIDMDLWAPPAIFELLQQGGRIAPAEMVRTFNCGI